MYECTSACDSEIFGHIARLIDEHNNTLLRFELYSGHVDCMEIPFPIRHIGSCQRKWQSKCPLIRGSSSSIMTFHVNSMKIAVLFLVVLDILKSGCGWIIDFHLFGLGFVKSVPLPLHSLINDNDCHHSSMKTPYFEKN